jgi:uncharacterized protein YhdP
MPDEYKTAFVGKVSKMTSILIQVQDLDGSWRQVNSTMDSNPQNIAARLDEASRGSPGKRVRAVDDTGSVIDIR